MDILEQAQRILEGSGTGITLDLSPLSMAECLRVCRIAIEFNHMSLNPAVRLELKESERQRQGEDFNWMLNTAMMRLVNEVIELRVKERASE